jgi:hypothetical protein
MSRYNAGLSACLGGGGSSAGGGSSGGASYAQGHAAGKTQGENDALRGRPFDDRCGGPTNEYCFWV